MASQVLFRLKKGSGLRSMSGRDSAFRSGRTDGLGGDILNNRDPNLPISLAAVAVLAPGGLRD